MKALSILVLLCSAASALEGLTCSLESGAAKIAVDHINEHHHHGYKFNLTDVELYETDLNEELCIMKMRLNLTETMCHVINPTSYEDCETRHNTGGAVVANCDVEIHMKENESSVNKYDCVTKRVPIDLCPDCPGLIDLTDPMGQLSVSKAVTEFNANISKDHYYVLQDIGRIRLGYMFHAGMGYFAEFALVETHCPRGSKIIPEACQPLCPDRAHYAFCKSSYITMMGLGPVDCEFYPPENTTVLETEPVCPRRHPHPGAPPPAGPPGVPPPAGPPGVPPPAAPTGDNRPNSRPGGVPPHVHGVRSPPCVGLLEYDHAVHPICPWPVPEIPQVPQPRDS